MSDPHFQNLMHLFIDLPIYKNLLHQSRGGNVSGKGGLFGTPGQWVMHNISSATRETLSDGLIKRALLSRSAYICARVCYACVHAHLCAHTNLCMLPSPLDRDQQLRPSPPDLTPPNPPATRTRTPERNDLKVLRFVGSTHGQTSWHLHKSERVACRTQPTCEPPHGQPGLKRWRHTTCPLLDTRILNSPH